MQLNKKGAIFLDRDGVLNIPYILNGKPYAPRKFEKFKLYVNTSEILLMLKKKGYMLIVVTNQPDISNRLMNSDELKKMNKFLYCTTPIDEIYVCSHSKIDNCSCRKPNPGMMISAISKYNLDKNLCWIVGDRQSDIQAGEALGIKGIFIDRFYKETNYSLLKVPQVSSLYEAAKIILDGENNIN